MRSRDITSTDVAALFGLSPYLTRFELWHNKKNNQIVHIDETERMGWGNRLESAIAESVCEDNLWTGRPMKDYLSIPSLRMGTSFDWFVEVMDNGVLTEAVLEIKNVDQFAFIKTWHVDGDIVEAPAHIEIQVQWQMLISGRRLAYIAALVGGNRLVLIERRPHNDIQQALLQKVAEFWQSIDNNEAPAPDFERDAAFISSLHKYAEPGKIIEADSQIMTLVDKYDHVSAKIKELTTEKDKYKAMMLELIGDAEKVKGLDFTVSCGVVGEAPISYIRKAYRTFRISFRGRKGEANE